MGNAALAEAAALRSSGPERETVSLPHGGIAAGPMEGAFGVPLTAEAPAFGSMSPIGTLAPAET